MITDRPTHIFFKASAACVSLCVSRVTVVNVTVYDVLEDRCVADIFFGSFTSNLLPTWQVFYVNLDRNITPQPPLTYFKIYDGLSPSLIFRPLLFAHVSPRTICHQKITVKNNTALLILLLLAGDISTNPGPSCSTKGKIPASIKLACSNLQSLRNKGPTLSSYFSEHKLSCMMITETWIKPSDTKSFISELTPPGFVLHHVMRSKKIRGKTKQGGGVGCFIHENVSAKIIKSPTYKSFEHIAVSTELGTRRLNLVTIYRIPGSCNEFFEEFQDFLAFLLSLPLDFIISGDFNIPFGNDSPDAVAIDNILDMFNLKQHVHFPTHKFGNTLDWLITSNECSLINKIRPTEQMSDHSSFIATLDSAVKLRQPKKTIFFRSFKNFDIDRFKADLANSDIIQHPDTNSSTSLYAQYHATMSTLLDKHAPRKSCTPNARPVNEWMTDEIMRLKRTKRQLENIWRRNRTDSNRSRHNAQVHLCNRQMSKAKKKYYSNLVSENMSNPRKLWDKINYILHKKKTRSSQIVLALPNLLTLLMNFSSTRS